MAALVSLRPALFGFVMCVIIAFFNLLSAAVPHWVATYTVSATFGLTRSCVGNVCESTNFDVMVAGTCRDGKGGSLGDRERATAAMVWISWLLAVAVLVVAIIARAGILKLSNVFAFALAGGCGGIAFLQMIGLAIYGNTMTSWRGCGTSLCEGLPDTASCGYGASFILVIFTLLLSLVTCALFVVRAFMPSETVAPRLEKVIITVLVIIVLCTLTSGATNRWFIIARQSGSVGLFRTCVGGKCTDNEYLDAPICATTGGSLHKHTDLGHRNNTVGTFMIFSFMALTVCAVMCALKFFGCVKKDLNTVTRVVAVAIAGGALFLQVVALIIFGATYDSWVGCGKSYCEVVTSVASARVACNYGYSLATAVICVLLTIGLLLVFIADLIHPAQIEFGDEDEDENNKNSPTTGDEQTAKPN